MCYLHIRASILDTLYFSLFIRVRSSLHHPSPDSSTSIDPNFSLPMAYAVIPPRHAPPRRLLLPPPQKKCLLPPPGGVCVAPPRQGESQCSRILNVYRKLRSLKDEPVKRE